MEIRARENGDIWAERIASWEESGMTMKQWCKDSSLCYNTFRKWRRRLEEEQNSPGTAPELCELVLPLDPEMDQTGETETPVIPHQAVPVLRIDILDQASVHVYADCPESLLKMVIRVMRDA